MESYRGTEIAREKQGQAFPLLREQGIDLWLLLTREGSDPAVPLLAGGTTVGAAAFLLNADGSSTAIVANYDRGHVERLGTFDRVVAYDLGLEDALGRELAARDPGCIAINYSESDHLCDGLSLGQYRWLERLLARLGFKGRLVSSEPALAVIRSVKSPSELERLEKAVTATCHVYDRVTGMLKPGMSEIEVSRLFLQVIEALGLESGSDDFGGGPIVMIVREGVAHRQPTGAVIKPGDILLVDMSVKYQHYVSDVARTLYFLRPGESHAPETIESAFRVVHRAISEAAAALRPGVKGYEVDAVARRVLTTSGYQEISHALGHQIGRSTHDGGTTLAPRWERYGQAPYGTVRAGEVYTLEPTIIQPEISILTEEDVVVTEWGVRWLSRRQEELICR